MITPFAYMPRLVVIMQILSIHAFVVILYAVRLYLKLHNPIHKTLHLARVMH